MNESVKRKEEKTKEKEEGEKEKEIVVVYFFYLGKRQKAKTTAPGLRAWSPTALLSGPERA